MHIKYADGCNGFLYPSLRPSGIHIPLTNCPVPGLWAGVVFGGHLQQFELSIALQ